jgi:aspartyl/glutamyl-tRNA(Asn/Gln) amidotransferase C subunit
MSTHISNDVIKHVAELANIPLSDEQAGKIGSAFDETLAVVENLKQVDITTAEPTHQVTGLENVMREDVVDVSRTFSQDEALSNAHAKHEGYFVVARILDND